MNWLVKYGEVTSEITEEPFEPDYKEGLPLIANGTYIVKMKHTKDLPNLLS